MTLYPKVFSELLASGSSEPFDTGDNWNVDTVTVNLLLVAILEP
jgi:hypothetical protein